MKNKIYIVLIVLLGALLVVQAAYIISLERSQGMLLARERLRRTAQPRQAALDTSFVMRQLPREYLIIMSLPGLSNDEININLKDKYLTVSGGRDTRSFLQVITLPEDARKKDITSEYKEGNLTIHIPKKR